MKIFKWLRPQTIIKTETVIEKVHVVDPQMGKRQLDIIRTHVNQKKYQLGDSIESVAYRQGQIDLFNFIETKLFGGKM